MTFTPKTAYIVSHTHWDREWYLTYHTFRVKLVSMVRRVLDALENDPDFAHFMLDGQSVALEDYLEVHPEDAGRIRSHVEQGRLTIGPWYILPDEYLISAESTVRNLLCGHQVCAAFGGAQKVGYMPDSFGHIAQTPQLLLKAGIDSFIYTRGNGDEIEELGHEYNWRAPDGSTVLAINQCGGYDGAGGLGFAESWHAHTRRTVKTDRARQQIHELFAKMERLSNGDIACLYNGCDHFPPQQDFGKVLAALRAEFPATEFIHTRLAEYIKAVQAAGYATKEFTGELCQGRTHFILSGVWSARLYLKQLNDEAQTLLCGCLEPLSAYTHFMQGADYPAGLIEYAWKLLLKNHPHDSICGCSTDEVHRDMLPRFAGVVETGLQSMTDQLENLAPTFARDAAGDCETVLCVFNPLPQTRSRVIERLVVLQPFGIDPDNLVLLDPAGNDVPFEIVDRWYIERFWGIDYRTLLDSESQLDRFSGYLEDFGERIIGTAADRGTRDTFLLIRFKAAGLPPVGHVNYRLTERPGGPPPTAGGDVKVKDAVIENAHCRVEVHPDGTLDIEHKATERRYTGLNLLESCEDIGDEYDYSPAADSCTVTSHCLEGELRVIDDGGLRGSIEACFNLPLPARISPDRRSRSAELTNCPVSVLVSLTTDSPVVDIDLCLDNSATDHRLRALFPTGIATDTVVSDGHFYTNERSIELPSGAGWSQPPVGTIPQQDFSLLEDADGGLALFNRGLPEAAAVRDAAGAAGLALTVLRCVGWLSRDDFSTRRGNAGPTIATPDAQCPGPWRFRYALVPFAGSWIDAAIKGTSQDWRTFCPVVQGVEDLGTPGGTGLMECTDPRLSVTAIKRHETRDTLVVRLYNLTGETVEAHLELGRSAAAAWETNLLEERGAALTVTDGRLVEFTAAGHAIMTIEIELG